MAFVSDTIGSLSSCFEAFRTGYSPAPIILFMLTFFLYQPSYLIDELAPYGKSLGRAHGRNILI